jgi:hypothetical protein
MGDIEIQIRRSTKATDEYKTQENIVSAPVRSPSITHQNGSDQEKRNATEEKANANPTYWDYSPSYGKHMRNKENRVILIQL